MEHKRKYEVIVRRIVREDITIRLEATSIKNATDLAMDEALVRLPSEWECYDCEYFADEDDVHEEEDVPNGCA
jgi:hypothetical protein